jgi:predicted nucleic acid-binding protein
MKGALVDSSVALDVLEDDPLWADRSMEALRKCAMDHALLINPIIYAEISTGFQRIEDLESAVQTAGFAMVQVPREALFLAAKAFLAYRGRGGTRTSPLPDFLIGAHAATEGLLLVTRDPDRIRTCYPTVRLLLP